MKKTNSMRVPFKELTVSLVMVAALAITVPTAAAADYYVFGRVYTAAQLAPEEDPPNNPLTGTPPAQIVGEQDLYALTSRSMVRVAILDDSTNTPLGSDYLVEYDGGYFLSFTSPATSLSIRFVVRDAVTGEMLMESGAVTVGPGSNLRFLLVPGEPVTIGGAIPFPDPGLGNTFLFTRVGKVEPPLINASGFVDVATSFQIARANDLGIPHYRDAPFGRNLFLFGAFSRLFYPETGAGSYCYKVIVNDGTSPTPITDSLRKVRYTLNPDGSVTAERILLGPDRQGVVSDCYRLTPIAETDNVFWSFPDLLMIWRTGTRNNPHTLSVELYNTSTGEMETLEDNTNSTLRLHLDNVPVIAEFNQIEQQTGGGVTQTDLLANPCDIVQLTGNRQLLIRYTARHPNGFLKNFFFAAVSNDPATASITLGSATYSPPPPGPLFGTPAGGTTITTTSADFVQACAYILRLRVRARTTNGYNYTNWHYRDKAYYVLP